MTKTRYKVFDNNNVKVYGFNDGLCWINNIVFRIPERTFKRIIKTLGKK